MKWLRKLVGGEKGVRPQSGDSTEQFLDEKAAKERLRELAFEIQGLKEPEDASPTRKDVYKAACHYSQALSLGYGTDQTMVNIVKGLDQLETVDPGNELNTQRVVLLREMWKIHAAKFRRS